MTDAKQRRFRLRRAGELLGLTEAQPENNVQRIVLEMLAGHPLQGRSCPRRAAPRVERGARAPGRGTSSGRCGSSRCSRTSPTCGVRGPLRRLERGRGEGGAAPRRCACGDRAGAGAGRCRAGRRERVHEVRAGRVALAARQRIETGEDVVVGVNRFETTEPVSPPPTSTPRSSRSIRGGGGGIRRGSALARGARTPTR